MGRSAIAVLIPAYEPSEELGAVVAALGAAGIEAIVVVDDGSGARYHDRFTSLSAVPNVTVLRHASNQGKGAALKTGMDHILRELDVVSIITADADGQHHPDDILRVADTALAHPDCLVLGSREFRSDVPLRSRLGNTLTRLLYRYVAGQRLTDTQTGLRAVPVRLAVKLLRVESNGYEFELDMLLLARQEGVRTREVPIRTIYLAGNRSSHFNPIVDSIRIYVVLLRYSAVSLVTALIDNVVFLIVLQLTAGLLISQLAGRGVALVANYLTLRRAVFVSTERHRGMLPKYLLLVLVNGALSYGLILLLTRTLPLSVIASKLFAETLLFIANFAIQRDVVFSRTPRAATQATDAWPDPAAPPPRRPRPTP